MCFIINIIIARQKFSTHTLVFTYSFQSSAIVEHVSKQEFNMTKGSLYLLKNCPALEARSISLSEV